MITTPSFVYRLFDADGALLYVGCSAWLQSRRSEHKREKAWWGEVAEWRITGPFASRARALAYEKRAITTEHPRYNRDPHEAGRLSWVSRRLEERRWAA